MSDDIFLSKEALIAQFADAMSSAGQVSYSFLLGAGFSKSAGIPLARDIAAILANYKIAKVRRANETLTEIIRRVLQEKDAWPQAAQALTSVLGPSFLTGDYSTMYTKLFDDKQIFPLDLRSQTQFVAELLATAEQMSLGWNFESLYLGYLCTRLHNHSSLRINTILTTNFDNVLVNSFSHLDGHFRVLDHPQAITEDTVDTRYPRLLYLHGRYLHYRVINSQRQMEYLLEALKDNHPRGKNHRIEAIIQSLRHASEGGGLIVIGYDGWEDAVMKVLERELANERGFDAGIIWCHYGSRESIRPSVLRLARESYRIKIVPNISALEVMQCLLGATGLSEAEVVRQLQRKGATEHANLRSRWVAVQERRHQIQNDDEEKDAGVSVQVGMEEVERVCKRAQKDSRFSSLAFELLRESLSSMEEVPVSTFSKLVRWRAELRVLYSGKPLLALADFYAILGMEPKDEVLIFLGLAEAYRQLGEHHKARICLARAYTAEELNHDEILLARCQFMDAQIRFESQTDIFNAERLCAEAESTFQQGQRLDLRAKCFVLRASMYAFNYQGNEGLGFAQRALDDAKDSGDRLIECKARLVEGYCYSTLSDFEQAARAFEEGRNIAVEGPQYRILASINLHLSDVKFAQGHIEEAARLLEEAVEYLRFVADVVRQEQAILTGLFNNVVAKDRAEQEEVDRLVTAVTAFERFEDEAESAGQWLAMVVSLLRLEDRLQWIEIVKRSADRCVQLAMSFEERGHVIEQEMATSNVPHSERERHVRLVAHVVQQSIVARLFYNLFGENEETATLKEDVRRDYTSLVNGHGQYGFASRTVEMIAAVIGYEIARRNLLPIESVLRYKPSAGPEVFSSTEVEAFCRAKGGWYFSAFLNRP
ncbi:MAG TPA: SIR2 family protein [Thermoanaerobaculia bacterium]|nr:SIR2 family protein [Thermoanaerobaculia bacterium]